MIQRRALSKRDGDLVAVDGVSFTVRTGQVTGVLGLLRSPARPLRWPFGRPLGSADSFHPGSTSGAVLDPARPSVLANQPPVHTPQGGAPMRPGS
jgi:hypothetical protein